MDVLSQVQRYGVAGLDTSGLLFEPRALWSVGRFDSDPSIDTPAPYRLERGVLQLPIEDFRNPGRYPIVITRLSFAPVNYLLAQNNDAAAASAITFRNSGAVLARTKFLLSVPRRQFYSKQPILVGSLASRPTADPSMVATSTPYASSLFGVSRLQFDKDLHLPANGGIELWLGCPTPPPNAFADKGPSRAYRAWITAEENGGLLGGACRAHELTLNTLASSGSPPIFEPDAFGLAGANGTSPSQFNVEGLFSLNQFLKQKTVRGGNNSASFQALNVVIDQIDFDDDAQDSALAGVAGMPCTPLSLRTPTRCRTRGGGTGQEWWRPGAPLGLVFTELTPATVYDLPQPITLNPGDALSVQLQFPTDVLAGPISPVYQVGVAASGFAVIEG